MVQVPISVSPGSRAIFFVIVAFFRYALPAEGDAGTTAGGTMHGGPGKAAGDPDMIGDPRHDRAGKALLAAIGGEVEGDREGGIGRRSEEHTSELPSLMRNSYAVFCLKKKTMNN